MPGRSCQDKLSRPAGFVHPYLNGVQNGRDPLVLVYQDDVLAARIGQGIPFGVFPGGVVVKVQHRLAKTFPQGPDRGGFSRRPRPLQKDHRLFGRAALGQLDQPPDNGFFVYWLFPHYKKDSLFPVFTQAYSRFLK